MKYIIAPIYLFGQTTHYLNYCFFQLWCVTENGDTDKKRGVHAIPVIVFHVSECWRLGVVFFPRQRVNYFILFFYKYLGREVYLNMT